MPFLPISKQDMREKSEHTESNAKKGFIKRHPYLICNLLCCVLASSSLWSVVSAWLGVEVILLPIMLEHEIGRILTVAIIITNILGFVFGWKGSKAGVAFAALAGSPGAFLAVHTVNRSCKYRKTINLIFIITMWVIVWALSGLLLFLYDYSDYWNIFAYVDIAF